eukprot:c5181_g1_i1.p1 GENE.c5181_g1_i1~~c5181_g1_i1.p1  ORF type:complete len:405 (+),score=93.42 c5181_g1_i1:54-1268(+)
MVLTSKQKEELDRAILDYLQSQGYTSAFAAFRTESRITAPTKEDQGSLEKKWTSVIRLQQKVLQLEQQVSELEARVGATVTSANRSQPQDCLPRPPHRVVCSGHRKPVTAVVMHPVFSTMASASQDGTIRLWDYESGQYETTLRGHTNSVDALAFSVNGELLASASSDGTLRLWNFVEQKYNCLRTLLGHDQAVSGVVFAPLGHELYSCGRDKTVRVWEVSSGFCKRVLMGHTDWVRSIDINRDGTKLVTGSNDQTVRVWNISNGQQIAMHSNHSHVVQSVCFAPPSLSINSALPSQRDSQDVVASGSRDCSIIVFDVATASVVCRLEGHDNWINQVIFHPIGAKLLSCSDDKSIKVWDLAAQRCVRTISNAHDQFVTSLTMNSQCSVLASGSLDQNIRLWQCS